MKHLRRFRLLALGVVLLVVGSAAATYWWVTDRRVVPVPVPTRFPLDRSPLGDVAFHAEAFSADATATLAPGRYGFDVPGGGRWIVTVPESGSATGRVAVRVIERGEEDGRRWIALEVEPSRLAFAPPVQVTDPRGVSVDVSELSADRTGASAAIHPHVARSLATLVASRVWAAPVAEPGNPVREVTVVTGSVALRDGGRFEWVGGLPGGTTQLTLRRGSEVRVRDLTVTGRGEIPRGLLEVTLAVGPGSAVRAGNTTLRADGGELQARVEVRRTGDTTRVELAPNTEGTLTLDRPRLTLDGVPGELTADRARATFAALSWEGRPDLLPTTGGRSRVELRGIALPGPVRARVESATATVSGDMAKVELADVRLRLPKQEVLAAVARAIPGEIKLPDHLVAANVIELFRDVRLTDLRVEPGRPELDAATNRVTFSARPLVRGRVTALGRQDVVTMRYQEVDGPFGVKVRGQFPVHELTWVPRVDLPFSLPLTLSGHATPDVLPGPSLAEARVRVVVVCEAVSVGEPTVGGLPEPVAKVVQIAAQFRNQIRVNGRSLPDHLREQATREEQFPLFGVGLPPDAMAVLQRVSIAEVTATQEGEEIVVTGTATLRGP